MPKTKWEDFNGVKSHQAQQRQIENERKKAEANEKKKQAEAKRKVAEPVVVDSSAPAGI